MTSPTIQAVRRRKASPATVFEVLENGLWRTWGDESQPPLGLPPVPAWRETAPAIAAATDARLPFAPMSFRDFMLSEQHVIDASRAMTRRYLPDVYEHHHPR